MSRFGDLVGRFTGSNRPTGGTDPALPGDGEEASPPAEGGSDPDDLFSRVRQWYREDKRHHADWIKEARECFDLVAGHQWDSDDLDILNEEERPAITFNRTGPFIDGVCGLELNNRQEVTYLPRAIGPSSGATDIMTAGAKWARDECDAEDEESEAFRDMIICGVGVTQTVMDYDVDPDGMIDIVRRDPCMVLFDRSAFKVGFADAGHVIYLTDPSLEEARARFPKVADEDLDARWARDGDDDEGVPHNATEAPFYRDDQEERVGDETGRVRLVEVEWWEYESGFRTHIGPNKSKIMTQEEHDKYQTDLKVSGQPPAKSATHRVKRYFRAVVGNIVLDQSEGPEAGGFTLKAMTGKRDRNRHCFYGLVRSMRDPQAWSNKWLSQLLHILNTSASSGAIVEAGVFERPNEAMEDYARPGSITVVKAGALSQNKILPKTPAPMPAAFAQLMETANDALPSVTGVTPEMMGQVDREQANVLEITRKESAITVLADFFNSLRKYRKAQGVLMLWMLHKYVADDRLIRVSGQGAQGYVKFTKQRGFDEYDVIIDDMPTSPNVKQKTWDILQQIMPMMVKLGLPPGIWIQLLDYLPLPATLINSLKQEAQKPQQPSPQAQAETALAQAKAALVGAQAQHQQAKTQIDTAQAHTDQITSLGDMASQQMDQEKVKAQVELMKAQAMAALATAGIQMSAQQMDNFDAALDRLVTVHGMSQDHVQGAHDRFMDVVGAHQQQQQLDQGQQGLDQQAQQAQADQAAAAQGGDQGAGQ